MPVVHECAVEGCSTLTMGELCLQHELETVTLARQLVAEAEAQTSSAAAEPAPA